MEEIEDTTNVSLIMLQGTIFLPKLLKDDYVKPAEYKDVIFGTQKDKMNKSSTSEYCAALRMRLDEKSVATLSFYAPKITITGSKDLGEIAETAKQLLSKIKCKYEVCLTRIKLTITFFNFGKATDIQDIHKRISKTINYAEHPKAVLDYSLAKIHVKGLRHERQIKEIGKLFVRFFSQTTISRSLDVDSVRYIMSNCKYNVGKKLNIWKLATLIRTVKNFEKSIVIYDNIGRNTAHFVMIILPLYDYLPPSHLEKIQRINVEATFKVTNTGYVTQSCPSRKCNMIAHTLFGEAVDELGAEIEREGPAGSKQ